MIIEFSRKIPSNRQKIIKKAVEFCCTKFISSRIQRNLILYIDDVQNRNYSGFVEWNIEYINPRDFTISVNMENNILQNVETIMHEMIHVKQFVKNELKHRFYPRKKIIWKNEEIDISSISYYELPWEIEAHSKQYDLAVEFIEREYKEFEHYF